MSSDTALAKLLKQLATSLKLVVDGNRRAEDLSKIIQPFIDESGDTPKAVEVVQSNPDDRHFKCILDTGHITIPDMHTIVADAKQMWSKEMGSVQIPAGLETGARKRILLFELVTGRSSQQIVDFCKKQPGAVMPNVFGLRIAEVTAGSKLPKDCWMRGFDDCDNLSVNAVGGRRVPRLYQYSNGGVRRGWLYWDFGWLAGLRFILFCD